MNASAIASLASNLAETGVRQQVGVSVLKRALDIEANTAAALISALPTVNLPAHLGNTINTTA